MPPSNLRSAVEALLFASDQPLTLLLLAEALESEPADVSAALKSLGDDCAAREAGIELREMAGGWLFTTASGQAEWVTRMLRGKRRMRLSRAALETMAIIAYKQPVTKSEVEAIRGVDASGVLATLLERNLVTIKGRSTLVGRPLLYGSTDEFLNYFGLRDLTELPRPEELRALVAAREPEQLEMLEMDPASGMPLALAASNAADGNGDAAAGSVAVADEAAGVTGEAESDAFSIEDADAAIAQAKSARAEAALAMTRAADDEAAGSSMLAGAGDLDESSDEFGGDDEDEDEYDEEDEDEEDEEDEDDDEEDDEDEAEDEDAGRPSASLARDDGGR
jgi:segregation and condensation protein B